MTARKDPKDLISKKPCLPPKIKLKRGRPAVYSEDIDENVRRLCLLGLSDTEIAEYLQISRKTMWDWDNAHPTFVNARAEGRVKADAKVASALHDRALGINYKEQQPVKLRIGQFEDKVELVEVDRYIPPDTHAAALWLSNRQRGRWSIKPLTDGEAGGEEVNIKITGGLPDE